MAGHLVVHCIVAQDVPTNGGAPPDLVGPRPTRPTVDTPLLLTESLRAKIADLGVAKLFDMHTLMHRVKSPCPGALDFMPPESF